MAQTVAGSTRIFPSILWFDLGNDKGAVNENTDSALQVTAKMRKNKVSQQLDCFTDTENSDLMLLKYIENKGNVFNDYSLMP